ncbi:hypothetical protein PISMIDRAFT_677272 [Pisolithus microcarpus 441]|uniref:Uncharacterized protein n=1 Tax=Pisolithus microcarpus 441 TaxID=765257 RepID=A0A0C9YJZ5_9AGAM|nr:hypothetical protein BKA83DRAFT_4324444 [Pisolithus microcarpus]KIK25280.1 hypothetical protein PISMIDRAFT_677272 [Pisolithus microcarpus 441]
MPSETVLLPYPYVHPTPRGVENDLSDLPDFTTSFLLIMIMKFSEGRAADRHGDNEISDMEKRATSFAGGAYLAFLARSMNCSLTVGEVQRPGSTLHLSCDLQLPEKPIKHDRPSHVDDLPNCRMPIVTRVSVPGKTLARIRHHLTINLAVSYGA